MKRPTLRLRRDATSHEEDRPLEIGVYDLLLPCRYFSVSYKIAEVGRVSLTTEFLLRLLNSVEGMREQDIAKFFGYDRREMTFLMSEAETNDFVSRRNGRAYLTPVGRGLFRAESTHPEVFEVHAKTGAFPFDLVAFAPEERQSLDSYDRWLPEMPTDSAKVGRATNLVRESFRKFYGEIAGRREPLSSVKRSLYSIDNVEAKDRFSSKIRITVKATVSHPSNGDADLSSWRSDLECEDRREILEAASRFIGDLKEELRPQDADDYHVLSEIAPDFLREFVRRDGFATKRYYREACLRAGDIRIDRPTAPIVGSLFIKENVRRLFDVLEYGRRGLSKWPPVCVWLSPSRSHWGASSVLPEVLDHIKDSASERDAEEEQDWSMTALALVAERAPRYVESVFDVVATGHSRVPRSLELLLVPNVMVAATIHLPIGSQQGVPTPLGFASFEGGIVSRAHAYVLNHVDEYAVPTEVAAAIRSVDCTA